MARSIWVLFLLSVLPVRAAADEGRRYALLVGVQQYDSEDMDDLRFTENDVEKLSEVLQRKPKPYSRIVVMTRERGQKDTSLLPTAANIRKQLEKLAAKCDKEDVLFVALTGHGVQPKGDKAYFCGYKAKLTDPTTMVPLDEVYSTLEKSDAGLKVLVVDACRNDPGGKGIKLEARKEKEYERVTTAAKPPAGVVALFSCSAGERSWEAEELKHGVFFGALIEGLGGAAARSGEEGVSWGSLAGYLQSRVMAYSTSKKRTQRPHVKGDVNSALALMAVPPGATTLVQNFRLVKPGEVPAGWERDDAVGVRRHEGEPCLEADTKGAHSTSTPKLRIEGDFVLDVVFTMSYYNSLKLTLHTQEGETLDLVLEPPSLGFYKSQIKLGKVDSGERTIYTLRQGAGKPWPQLRLEREEATFRVIDLQNPSEALIARPIKEFSDKTFEKLTLTLTANEDAKYKTRVFAVGISPRRGKK